MSISDAEKSFLRAIEQEDESTICNLINVNDELRNKYLNTYKGYKLLKDTMQKNLLKSALILINEGCPIKAVNETTPLHIALKLNSEHLVRDLIKKGADINIPDENGDYPIHIVTNHEYYDLILLLIHYGAKIDVRDGNNETPLIRAIKSSNVQLIKLCRLYDADMNDFWPNTNETIFYYLTVTNPFAKSLLPYEKMNMEIISNIALNYLMHSNIIIQDIHICNEDLLEFLIGKNLYDLLLRFNLDKMNLPFLKYKAIIHNRMDILEKLMSYNSIDNDKYDEKYSLLRAAFETSNKDAYDILEKYRYSIRYNKHIYDYFLPYFSGTYFYDDWSRFTMSRILFRDNAYYWLKICLKRKFLCLDDIQVWYYLIRKNVSLNIYTNIFINMNLGNISDIWLTLKCFSSVINILGICDLNKCELVELYLSEVIRLDSLNRLPNRSEFTIIFTNKYLMMKYEHVKYCVDQLKSITIYENQNAFNFYLQKKRYRNVDILKEIMQNIKEKSNSYGISYFISIPLIKRLEREIKKEILMKEYSLVLSQLFDWPILIQEKILSYFTIRELKVLCKKMK